MTDLRIGDKVVHEVKLDNEKSNTWIYGGHLPLLFEVFLPVGFWVQGGVQGSLYLLNLASSNLEISLEPRLGIGWGW